MTTDDAPPPSRRARRVASTGSVPTAVIVDGHAAPASVDPASVDRASVDLAPVERAPVDRALSGRIALTWIDDEAVPARAAPPDLAGSANPYVVVPADLLARRPRRSPLRPGIVVPILGALGLVGVYAATTLLWPLYAVPPVVKPIALADLTSPATAVAWPAEGSAAVGIAGFDGAAASSPDPAPMASITKLVTALMILDEMPLTPGQSGPEFAFTSRDRQTYYDYLDSDESALDVPVGGTLTQYQLLQGMLIGSAGNYADRLAGTLWPNDTVFAAAATAWLAQRGLTGITVVDPTGIDTANTADPASLIALARAAMADPVVAEIVRTPAVTLPGAGEVVNTNDLLTDPAVIGVKTGSLSTGDNLLAARDQQTGDVTVRAYAAVLSQSTDAARDAETTRLLAEVTAEASQPRVLPAGTLVGTVTTPWGATASIVTAADASLLLWNGAAAGVASDLSLGDARTKGAAVGTVSMKGPLGAAETGARLTADLPEPDAWWRLTHPLQLFGLVD